MQAPQRCSPSGRAGCMENGGAVGDASTCPCPGRATAVVGTVCAKSCSGAALVCFAGPGEMNPDCSNGLRCIGSDLRRGFARRAPGPAAPRHRRAAVAPVRGQDPAGAACSAFACSSAPSCAPVRSVARSSEPYATRPVATTALDVPEQPSFLRNDQRLVGGVARRTSVRVPSHFGRFANPHLENCPHEFFLGAASLRRSSHVADEAALDRCAG